MRTMVIFDLPVETASDRRNYRHFRKYLIDEGFWMMQESVYTKICVNMHAVEQVEKGLRLHKPPRGIVQVMTVTERQFAGMETLVGEADTTMIQTDERFVIL